MTKEQSQQNRNVSRLSVLILVLAGAALLTPASALAARPTIAGIGIADVTETSATLTALVDPNAVKVEAFHFDYTSQADYEAEGFGAGTLSTPDRVIPATVKGTGTITAGSNTITGLTTVEGTFAPGQTLAVATPGIAAETKIIAATATSLTLSKAATASSPPATTVKANGPQPVAALIEGLAPATAYRFRTFAKNTKEEEALISERSFQTHVPSPVFGPCPNDVLRIGELAPPGALSAHLPDCRAYEQASPVEKDGGDAHGISTITRAAEVGAGIIWGSNFGAPGGSGAQGLPFFAAVRGPEGLGWSSQGLLPPPSLGEAAKVRGWLPDFSEIFVEATRLGAERTTAFFALHRDGSPPSQIAPYLAAGDSSVTGYGAYSFIGASADGKSLVFESPAALPASTAGGPPLSGAKEGGMNVYAWDASSGQVSLLSTMNSEAENAVALPKGAFAGPYDWAIGRTNHGGSSNRYYLPEQHALSPDTSSLYFTAYGSGQLYRRVNPIRPQSPLDGEGSCTDPALACTTHVSTSRTPPDPTGAAPAAFQYASADGSKAYFTSSEELTADANTGPEQPPAQIGRTDLTAPDPDAAREEDFIPTNAAGIATSPDGEWIYWANPVTGDIGRADLAAPNPAATVEASFVEPGTGECEVEVEVEKFKFEVQEVAIPSIPRYVALDPAGKYLFWTNGGLHGGEKELPIDGGGTIGRAELDGSGNLVSTSVEPDFICGEVEPSPGTREAAVSNAQGIAANSEYVYWANGAAENELNRSLARAQIDGSDVEGRFVAPGNEEPKASFNAGRIPYGVALDASHVYFTLEEPQSGDTSSIDRVTLEGTEPNEFGGFGIGKAGIRGLTVDSTDVYWATQGEEAIGRAPLADLVKGNCVSAATCENEYLKPAGTLNGLAIDGTHIYWSVNGDTPPNPGSDLYLYEAAAPAGQRLSDLTPDPSLNGAEVKGVLGGSEDGSYLYFVANGALGGGGEASAGDCRRPDTLDPSFNGACNLYLLHNGATTFIARLDPGTHNAESWNWLPYRNLPGTRNDPKTAAITADGRTLLLRSAEDLGGYEAHGAYQLYRYRVGEGLTCLSCDPSAESGFDVTLGLDITFGNAAVPVSFTAASAVHFFAAEGNRVFFETAAGMVAGDTNGVRDVYEWEAPAVGTCSENGPGYFPTTRGCLYLISTGRSIEPAFFADASPDGTDVFFLTRERLVSQDTDNLRDVYDARAGGGLAAQNPVAKPPPCEGEACKPGATPPPLFSAPPDFSGPPDPTPKRPNCRKARKSKKKGCSHHKMPCKKRCTHKRHGGSR